MDLARLTLKLEAENLALTTKLEQTTRRLQTFQRSTKSITDSVKTALVGLGAGFSVVAFTRSMRDTINGLDDLNKEAQKTGAREALRRCHRRYRLRAGRKRDWWR